jgi:hypothetical protein
MQTGQTGTVVERLSGEQPALRRNGRPGEATVRVDATIAYLLLKEVFRRTAGVTSFFGILIAIGALERELRRIAAPALRRARPRRPSFASTMIAIAMLRESFRSIAGDPLSNSPYAGRTIALGLLAPAVRRIAGLALIFRAAVRGVRAAIRSVFVG